MRTHWRVARLAALAAGVLACSDLRAPTALDGDALQTQTTSASVTTPDLSATPISHSQINLGWQDNATNETGFEVHRSTGGTTGTFSLLATTGKNVTSYADAGLSASTEYCYKLQSFRTTGRKTTVSAFTSTACATTAAPPPPPPPPAPRQLQVTAITSGTDLDADGYYVEIWKSGTLITTGQVPTNGTVTIEVSAYGVVLSPGPLSVTLVGIAANCDLVAQDPAVIEESVTYTLTCSALTQLVIVDNPDGSPDIFVIKSDGSARTRLTSDAASDVDPVWSPDGGRIAFASDRDGNAEIYVMNADGSNPVRLTDSPGADVRPVWSPDGARIAFVSDRDGNREIYAMNADGTNAVNLSNSPFVDADPAWSPDGSRLAFVSNRDTGYSSLYLMSADGSNVTQITVGDWYRMDSQPAWAPDGSSIALSRWTCVEGGCSAPIVVLRTDGTIICQLTLTWDGEVHASPTWSPDGRKIAFASDYVGVKFARLSSPNGMNGSEWLSNGVAVAWRR